MGAKIIPTDPVNPEPVEVIAADVQKIADAMEKINSSRLNRKALVALIHDNSKVSKRTIEVVLNNLSDLAEVYLKKRK